MSCHYQEQIDINYIYEPAVEMLLKFKFETLKLIFPTLPSFWKIWQEDWSIDKVLLLEHIIINFFNFILYKWSLLMVCFIFLPLMILICSYDDWKNILFFVVRYSYMWDYSFRVLCLAAFVEMLFGVQYIFFPYIWICFVCNICLVGTPLTFKHILKCKWILELFTFLPGFLGGILEKWDYVLTVICN